MRKLLLLGTFAATLLLAGCEEAKLLSEKRTTMVVESVYLTSKSNSKVNLREVESGYVWKDQRLSCSRSRASNVEIGSKWDVVEQAYVYPESQRYFSRLVGVDAICTKST
ncbi:putative anti-sigma factor [Pseudomonas phage PPSC2]|uniref:Putative anti-sigma factor n=1 Tax=Pseudomonas phage PPSC2 TaxID=2041350 RepID=A0A2R2YAZ8_9CAUD|nr:putative anti-sigma factor [Pseudomonas phage PPSC2]ATN92853.1 putative anti-sigma factor [Pseudomonas phage PPSC2]